MRKRGKGWLVAGILVLALGVWFMACSGGDKPEKPQPADKPIKPDKPEKPETPAAPDKPVSPDKPAVPEEPASPTPPASDKGSDVKTFSYMIEMESAEEGKMRMELKADGDKRMNMKMSGWENNAWKDQLWLINDGTYMYMVDTANKTVMKMKSEEQGMSENVPEDLVFVPEWDKYQEEYLKDVGVSKEGEADLNGVKTTKYKVKGLEGSDTGYIYVDKNNLIRKLEAYDADGKLTVGITFHNIEINPKLSDSDFAPPADYQVMDMSNMMPNTPGGMPPNMPPMPETP